MFSDEKFRFHSKSTVQTIYCGLDLDPSFLAEKSRSLVWTRLFLICKWTAHVKKNEANLAVGSQPKYRDNLQI